MGVSSIDGSVSEPMLDAEQRKTYFAEPELKERGGTKETGKEQRKELEKEKQWLLTSIKGTRIVHESMAEIGEGKVQGSSDSDTI